MLKVVTKLDDPINYSKSIVARWQITECSLMFIEPNYS